MSLKAESSTSSESRFVAWLQGPSFSCVAARAAANRGTLITRSFGDMRNASVALQLHSDLRRFATSVLPFGRGFSSYAALFPDIPGQTESAFEENLWRLLVSLRAVDKSLGFGDVPGYSANTGDPRFALSLVDEAWFVVGMHSSASRISRRFEGQGIAFNAHSQFQRLRAEGRYERLRERIRDREMLVQGALNDSLADWGTTSEARQYGSIETNEWSCPIGRL